MTYSFVHGDLLTAVDQKPANSFAITNAISPNLQYYRQTLTPSLLELVHPNIKAGTNEFVLFEINKTHNKVHGKDSEGLPGELEMTAMVYANKKSTNPPAGGAPFFVVRRYLDFVASQLGLEFVYSPIDKKPDYPVTAPFDWQRSAYVTEKKSGVFLGIIGEYRQAVIKNLKLPQSTAGCELGTEHILEAVQATEANYKPMSKYPGTSQDITFQVDEKLAFSDLEKTIQKATDKLDVESAVLPVGIYKKDKSRTKNITFTVRLTDQSRTITREQAGQYIASICSIVTKSHKAKII